MEWCESVRPPIELPNMIYTLFSNSEVSPRLTESCMPWASEVADMSDGRALLTDREREILAGADDVSDNYRYKVESVARQRVRQIGEDVEVLREHYPEIFAELQDVVCNPDE